MRALKPAAREFDFTGAEPPPPPQEQKPDYVPEGWYDATIIWVDERRGRAEPHHHYYAWELMLEGVHPDFRLWAITSHSPKAIWRLKELIEACGYEVRNGRMTFDPKSLINARLSVEVRIESFREKLSNRVAGFRLL